MKIFFNKKTKKYSWEKFLNYYIKDTSEKFHLMKKQNYFWVNINTMNDYLVAKKYKLN